MTAVTLDVQLDDTTKTFISGVFLFHLFSIYIYIYIHNYYTHIWLINPNLSSSSPYHDGGKTGFLFVAAVTRSYLNFFVINLFSSSRRSRSEIGFPKWIAVFGPSLEYDGREHFGGENDDSHNAGQRNQLDNTRQHKVSIHQPATQQTSGPELPSCTAAGCSPVKKSTRSN